MTFTIVDWVIVAILVGSVLAGVVQGFLRSVFSLGGLLLGLVVAAWNYLSVAAMLRKLILSEKVAEAIAFVVIAVVVTAIVATIGVVLSKVFKKIGLGCLDSLAGAIFGLFQGALLVTVFILVTVAFFPDTEWLTQASLPKYFFGAIHMSTDLSPSILSERVRQELNRLERESPTWMHPKPQGK
ncbi:MAG TPA: CvpA family protein [Terracidiphilus sp.]|nr:CvpA family protein [Terracidiphilus sp.]